ncbi:MAG TPA: hypothetical protein PLZ08_06990 [Bacillota bacterium]|jgi:hypothetical protein|nr:hypothetical protein [Bacillota bacterium]HOL09468.1 hypothetical protein [Bacillota bacterium]HPO97690.1 hypothetical protein [Bacillota bacterium]
MNRKDQPEQLHLALEWNYLDWIEFVGEEMQTFERSTRSFFRKTRRHCRNPIFQELISSSGDNL